MVNRPKNIGTAAETAVVNYLRVHGFGCAERSALAGSLDRGDITGTPGVCWEVKAGQAAKTASDGQVQAWLLDTERERLNCRGADHGVLVMARGGYGAGRCGNWWAVVTLGTLTELLITAELLEGLPMALTAPVRLHLSTVVDLLQHAGYGDPTLFEVETA